MTQLLVGITLYKNKVDTRMWEGEVTSVYTIQSESDLIDNIYYSGKFPYSSLLWKGFSTPKIKMFI